jgi:hypothetical protein
LHILIRFFWNPAEEECQFMAQFLLTVLQVLLALTFWIGIGSGSSNHYNAGDHVPLFVNKVGPLHNPRLFSNSNLLVILMHFAFYWLMMTGE